jgi:TatA/E family protein of Tat protein translocase
VFNLGPAELIFILILALLIFGPKRLPELGRTIGKGMAEFRKASNDLKRSIESEMHEVEEAQRPAVSRLPQRPPAGTAAVGAEPLEEAPPPAGPRPLDPQ